MDPSHSFAEVAEWLRRQGHTEDQISKIVGRVRQYDKEMQTDSIMDSIEDGTFDIAAVIREALADVDEPG